MKKISIFLALCLFLTGCGTLQDIKKSPTMENLGDAIGSFELSPTALNNYWYDGNSYDYNEYQIKITSEPAIAKILWEGKQVGATPMVYHFTGKVNVDDYIKVEAVPFDEKRESENIVFSCYKPLPREIHFKLE